MVGQKRLAWSSISELEPGTPRCQMLRDHETVAAEALSRKEFRDGCDLRARST
jgi:hypothetical protein